MAVRQGGRDSVTHYRVIKRFRAHTHVRVQLETGRTHQIRLHLAHAGCPVAGDILYGRRDFHGLALRAFRLEYPDPFLHRSTLIIAPTEAFCRRYGYDPLLVPEELRTRPRRPVAPAAKVPAGKAADEKTPASSRGAELLGVFLALRSRPLTGRCPGA